MTTPKKRQLTLTSFFNKAPLKESNTDDSDDEIVRAGKRSKRRVVIDDAADELETASPARGVGDAAAAEDCGASGVSGVSVGSTLTSNVASSSACQTPATSRLKV
jgi:hypothetical protein